MCVFTKSEIVRINADGQGVREGSIPVTDQYGGSWRLGGRRLDRRFVGRCRHGGQQKEFAKEAQSYADAHWREPT